MEFWQTFVQFVQQMGFPIAICCYLLYDRRMSDDAHKEEVSKMTDALNNNTLALSRILEVLRLGEGES